MAVDEPSASSGGAHGDQQAIATDATLNKAPRTHKSSRLGPGLWQVLWELRCNNLFCDIKLYNSGQTISAHRVVLAGCSKYFHDDSDTRMIDGMDFLTLHSLVKFAYTGKLTITKETVHKLQSAAEILKMTEVQGACHKFLTDKESPELKRLLFEEKKKEKQDIFLNKTFILTSANRTLDDVGFKKNAMKKQILERGGTVVEDINQAPPDAKETYLIAGTHYRTPEYMTALSMGIPCLLYLWLMECVQVEKFLPYEDYKLPAGKSLHNDDEWYPLPDVRDKLLVGRTIMVHSRTDAPCKSGTKGFNQIWSQIVELLGGRVVSDACLANATPASISSLECPDDFDILLTDSTCLPEVVEKLESAGKDVVSSEWLIQSIIEGACLDFSANPNFRYNYSGNEPDQKKTRLA